MKTPAPSQAADRRPLDRALAAAPLVLAYLLLCVLYAWQASQRSTPTIFNDELEFAQISRSIAETGQAARRGEAYGFQTLYAYLVAPAWWIDDTTSAYEVAKFIGVLVMTSTIFPAYALARTIVSKPWALGAAVAAAAVPALSYAPFLVEEPLAYPYATLVLWLIVRALVRPGGRRIAVAAVACVVAPFVRSQLAILLPVFGLALAFAGWEHERFRARRATWTRADYAGVVILGIGVVVAASAYLGHQSTAWYTSTLLYKERMFDYGLRALGSLVIGVGVLPFVAGLATVLGRVRDPDARVRGFVTTALAAFFTFGLYTAVKAAYLSATFGTVTVERNLIYLTPLLFAGTALALAQPRLRIVPLALAGAVALYVLVTTPLELDRYPYYDAPGLSIASLPNRNWGWDGPRIEQALVVVLVVCLVLLVAQALLRARHAVILAGVIGALVMGWNLTAEVYAARGFEAQADQLYGNLPKPVDWVDEANGGAPTLFLGAGIDDANGVHLLEFWNRSIKKVWATDGTAPGPGPFINTDLAAADGTLFPDPEVGWVVAENDAAVVGRKIGEPRGVLQLYRTDGAVRLVSSFTGLTGDGWMAAEASYNQFATTATPRGYAKVILSRVASCGPDKPGTVTVKVGTVVVGAKNQPALGRVLQTRSGVLHQCEVLGPPELLIPATVPFRVEVTITPTFSPNELDPASSDVRQLGARPEFSFVPLTLP